MPASVSGLKTFSGILDFKFLPSLSIMARDVDKLGLEIRSFREPLTRAVREVMVPSIRTNFDVGGRPPWEPLAEGTVTLKEFYGYGDKTLVRSGKLRQVASQINIWTINEQSATVRDLPESVWYGKVHQAGFEGGGGEIMTLEASGLSIAQAIEHQRSLAAQTSSAGRQAPTIPARPFIMFQDEDIDKIEAVFATWLDERLLATWSRKAVL